MRPTPYQETVDWIEDHPESPAASQLAKLVLSLASGECAFSLRDMFDGMETAPSVLALRVIARFAQYGEDEELREVGLKICDGYQDLCVLGQVAHRAQATLISRWQPSPEHD